MLKGTPRKTPALALGDVWVLHQLWHELGFDRLHAVFRRARYTTPVEQATTTTATSTMTVSFDHLLVSVTRKLSGKR